nr:hypothetical protein [Nocardiopsis ansamitocini]
MGAEKMVVLAQDVADDDPMAGLASLAQLRAEVEQAEAVLVRRARVNGATWAQIASALGVSKQAAHKKYCGRRLFGGS